MSMSVVCELDVLLLCLSVVGVVKIVVLNLNLKSEA